jgi:hypothetical protein
VLAGGAANALHVEPAAPPPPPPPQPQQAVVGAGPYIPAGAGSPPLPPNAGAEAAQAVAVVPAAAQPHQPNLHFRPVAAASGGVVSMSGQSALGRVPSPPPTDGATPIAENW